MIEHRPIVYMREGNALSSGLLAQLGRSVTRQYPDFTDVGKDQFLRLNTLLRSLPIALDILTDTRCAHALSQVEITSFQVNLHMDPTSFQDLTSSGTVLLGFHDVGSRHVEIRLLKKGDDSHQETQTRLATVRFMFKAENVSILPAGDNTTDPDLGIVIERIPANRGRSSRAGERRVITGKKPEEP